MNPIAEEAGVLCAILAVAMFGIESSTADPAK